MAVPSVGGQHAVQQVEQRGLAGAVRADDAQDFAGTDLEADAADRAQAAERPRQAFDLQQQRCRR